jgi:hypothetical protein
MLCERSSTYYCIVYVSESKLYLTFFRKNRTDHMFCFYMISYRYIKLKVSLHANMDFPYLVRSHAQC